GARGWGHCVLGARGRLRGRSPGGTSISAPSPSTLLARSVFSVLSVWFDQLQLIEGDYELPGPDLDLLPAQRALAGPAPTDAGSSQVSPDPRTGEDAREPGDRLDPPPGNYQLPRHPGGSLHRYPGLRGGPARDQAH